MLMYSLVPIAAYPNQKFLTFLKNLGGDCLVSRMVRF
jgi:hypothetical protein